MEKVKFAPINPVNYESNLQEITAEELEEAGIVVDYVDNKDSIDEQVKQNDLKQSKKKFRNYMRWILLCILILFITVLINFGTTCIDEKERVEGNARTFIVNSLVQGKEQHF